MSEEKEGSTLLQVKGIGPKTVEKLEDAGVSDITQLAVMRPEELKSLLGITLKAAKDIVNDAKNKALDKAIKTSTFAERLEHRRKIIQRIPTGCSELDRLLKGGVPTEAITTFKGEFASGKTQFCNQLAVNCLKYLKRKVIWIETEASTFIPERVKEMADAIGLKINGENDFIVIPADQIATPYNQFLAYERAMKEARRRNMDVGLFIVDSFTAKFRGFYSGREMFPDRAKEEARHLGYLDMLASNYNMAVVLTAQVMGIPDTGQQLGERVKTGHTKRMWGGDLITHWSTYIISLQKMSLTDWEAIIADAPDVAMKSVRFRLTSAGIRDIPGRRR